MFDDLDDFLNGKCDHYSCVLWVTSFQSQRQSYSIASEIRLMMALFCLLVISLVRWTDVANKHIGCQCGACADTRYRCRFGYFFN